MFDSIRLYSLLERIEGSIVLILDKTESIKSPDDFLTSSDGLFTLSGVCMQLIFIGENVKVVDNKTDHIYLQDYPEIPWVEIMGLRDIIAHEYHRIDSDEIFQLIKNDLPLFLSVVRQMKDNYRRNG